MVLSFVRLFFLLGFPIVLFVLSLLVGGCEKPWETLEEKHTLGDQQHTLGDHAQERVTTIPLDHTRLDALSTRRTLFFCSGGKTLEVSI